jgi:two-component system, cell cycle sensor histidine kinase and response regulator CckA
MQILIVDDGEDNRYLLEALLKGNGHDVLPFSNGAEALERLQEGGIELIISDILMPVMDGFQLCRKVKADEAMRRIPFIFYTATYTGAQDEAFALKLGADRFVQKPCEPYELMKVIRDVTASSPPGGASVSIPAKEEEVLKLYNERLIRKLEQKMLELEKEVQARQKAEARYRTIFENAAEGILINETSSMKFKYINPAICQILGYSNDELTGLTWMDILNSGSVDRVLSNFKTGEFENRSMAMQEVECLKNDGTLIYADIVATSGIFIEGGYHSIVFFQDVTQKKKAEDEKKKIEAQLVQAQKLEAVGRLTGGIAHDFNNMLTTIIGNAEIALSGIKKTDALREIVEDIKEAGEKAAILTRQLLAFSRRQIFQPEIFNLNEVVTEMDKMLKRVIGEDIQLDVALSQDLDLVETDPGQIEQIILNLAVNARDAMPQGGKLTIETSEVEVDDEYASRHYPMTPGHYVMLVVNDTGSGMTRETQSQIFDPFFTTKPKGKGTGLGLSIVYGIVKQSNGYIWVYSELNMGTTFKIYLPRVESDEYAAEEKREGAKEESGGSETLMVVEDDAMIMKVIKQVLVSSGYNVLTAGDGKEALRLFDLHKGHIDMLLTDIIMPGMGGRDLADQMKQTRPDLKVLYMSGYTDDAIVRHGMLEKGLSFIQKPFASGNLKKKVREVLG